MRVEGGANSGKSETGISIPGARGKADAPDDPALCLQTVSAQRMHIQELATASRHFVFTCKPAISSEWERSLTNREASLSVTVRLRPFCESLGSAYAEVSVRRLLSGCEDESLLRLILHPFYSIGRKLVCEFGRTSDICPTHGFNSWRRGDRWAFDATVQT